MLNFDPGASVEENLNLMTKAADNVSSGSITFAARDSDFENRAIKEGDILALDNGKLSFTDTSIAHAVTKLTKNMATARRLLSKDVAFVTLMYGEGVSQKDATAAKDALAAKLGSDVEITVIEGGQPIYYYFISVE
jgi:dihydroxyacetone kinase-like predicted kinase